MSKESSKPNTTPSYQIAQMNEDRPLDALFPELAQPYAPNDGGDVAEQAVHPPMLGTQVLEVELEHAQRWCMVCWRAPDEGESLETSLRDLLEATLLQEMSRPPGWGGAKERHVEGIDLFVFEELDESSLQALARLGFVRAQFEDVTYGNRLHAWKNEALQGGWRVATSPASLWHAPLSGPEDRTLADALREAHEEIAVRHDARLWGAYPGEPSHTMASVLERTLKRSIEPTMESLHELDVLLIERRPGVIRWIEPMVFQGLCDFMGIVLMANQRARVQWGVCESDNHGGHLPPVFRLSGRGGARDVEVGRALLRHAVMPRMDAPELEMLTAWFERVFFPKK